jgi:hypothetical protein
MKTTVSSLALILGLALVTFVSVHAQQTEVKSPVAEMQLPPGWTAEDMQAMVAAATPGQMHAHLAKDVGTWKVKTKSWMAPKTDAIESAGTSKVSPLMDGRYVMAELTAEMPGMGPFNGLGIYGYDNLTKQFVASWIDNAATSIMHGTGELSADGKTLTWKYQGTCPLTKKPIVMREVDTIIDANTKKMEMFGPYPKTGEEFKMMEIVLTRD